MGVSPFSNDEKACIEHGDTDDVRVGPCMVILMNRLGIFLCFCISLSYFAFSYPFVLISCEVFFPNFITMFVLIHSEIASLLE